MKLREGVKSGKDPAPAPKILPTGHTMPWRHLGSFSFRITLGTFEGNEPRAVGALRVRA
jgi:hypothetical protein